MGFPSYTSFVNHGSVPLRSKTSRYVQATISLTEWNEDTTLSRVIREPYFNDTISYNRIRAMYNQNAQPRIPCDNDKSQSNAGPAKVAAERIKIHHLTDQVNISWTMRFVSDSVDKSWVSCGGSIDLDDESGRKRSQPALSIFCKTLGRAR